MFGQGFETPQLHKNNNTMKKEPGEVLWIEYCPSCKRKHIFKMSPCPTCGVYWTPQPKSEIVLEKCNADYSCDGCQAYRDHTN